MTKRNLISFTLCLILQQAYLQNTYSKYIVVDQFGYTQDANKIAVIRDPEVGYDAQESYSPGQSLRVVNIESGAPVFTANIKQWSNGATDTKGSGDRIWWFDFSEVKQAGQYYIEDLKTNQRSAIFKINDDVYKDLLKVTFKSFFYQRAGFDKTALFAGDGWADKASHIGPLQDRNCRPYNNKQNQALELDLSGGWYDAGDYNKYTPWTANYIITLLQSYEENTKAWTDDFGIPESGNGVPDILDEIKWGLDWLLKMSQPDGGSLCVMGLAHKSPPSSANGQSTYGPATTNATLRSAAAFSYAAKILSNYDAVKFGSYCQLLTAKAESGWKWALNNPSKIFNNNTTSNGSQGLGAGNQETDSLGRLTAKMGAALHLYELTQKNEYLDFFELNIDKMPLLAWGTYLSQYFMEQQDLLFDYTKLAAAKAPIKLKIINTTKAAAAKGGDFISAVNQQLDPYRAFIKDYNWGSNQYKGNYGNFFRSYTAILNEDTHLKLIAEEYLHYIHGVNPLSIIYITQTSKLGGENNIKEFYHSWFENGSSKWDREGVSTFGPAPGFLSGGPNQFYSKDGCCPSNCGSATNNAMCNENVSPPLNQPPMKSYKDFNTSWPINSWSVTENSNGYQCAYLRLLSKYVNHTSTVATHNEALPSYKLSLYPNPSSNTLQFKYDGSETSLHMTLVNASGQIIWTKDQILSQTLDISYLPAGHYFIKYFGTEGHGQVSFSKE